MINDKFEIDTDFSLKKGRYMGEFFDEMIFSGLLKDDIFHIDDISMTRKGEMGLQASGTVPIKKEYWKDIQILLYRQCFQTSLRASSSLYS